MYPITALDVPALPAALPSPVRLWRATAYALAIELDRSTDPTRWMGTDLHRALAALAARGELTDQAVLKLLVTHGCPDTRASQSAAARIVVTTTVLQAPLHRRRGTHTITPGVGRPGRRRTGRDGAGPPWAPRRW